MKKKLLLLSFLTISCFSHIYGQNAESDVKIPNLKIVTPNKSINSKNSEYDALKSNLDSSTLKIVKRFERWVDNNLYKLQIDNDTTYSLKNYFKSLKQWVQSDNYCGNDEFSNWSNIGPSSTDHNNGWVSAVCVSPNDINKILIGTKEGGLFKTTDMGNHWICVTDNLNYPFIGIRQIVVNPFNNSQVIAVLGGLSGYDLVQNNYMISNDFGTTWELGFTNTLNGNLLNQIRFLFYHQSIQGLVLGVSDNKVIISSDNGYTWGETNLPIDITNSFSSFTEIVAINNDIYLADNNRYGAKSSFWKGDLVNNGGVYSINWSSDLSYLLMNKKLSDSNPIDLGTNTYGFVSYTHSSTHYDLKNSTTDCSNHPNATGNFARICTEGWSITDYGGIGRLSCNHGNVPSGPKHDKEIITYRLYGTTASFLYSNDKKIQLKYFVPKGAKLKICWNDYLYVGSSAGAWNVCNLNEFDYTTLFQNVIYESQFSTQDQTVEIDQNMFLNSALINQSSISHYIYFIVEFNSEYDEVNLPKLNIEEFDIYYGVKKPEYINFSNVQNDQFYILSKQGDSETMLNSYLYFKVDVNGDFTEVNGTQSAENAGNIFEDLVTKSEIVNSLNNSNKFYQAAVEYPRSGNIVFSDNPNNPGHHDDYRSSCIVDVNGEDYIFWGTDGGICYTPNGLGSIPELISLNGDLQINMIYNLDVHDKTGNILVGLQDNKNAYFNESTSTWSFLGVGDGCISMIQEEYPFSCIIGDPQSGGSLALYDCSASGAGVNDIVNNANSNLPIEGEAYLGMKLVNYLNFPNSFVIGLREMDSSPEGKVIINDDNSSTVKKTIPYSSKIKAIGVSQYDKEKIYVAEGVPTELGAKLFLTTDKGDNWDEINPTIATLNGPKTIRELFNYKFITALETSPSNDNVLYVGSSGVGLLNGVVTDGYLRVLKSENSGTSFYDWSTGLPALPVNQLLAVDCKSNLIFCATDAGVYYRMDGMEQWECFSTNLPLTRITDLDFNYCTRTLYCSTFGRGVWKSYVPFNIETVSEELVSTNTIWNAPRTLKRNLRIQTGHTLEITTTVDINADRKIIIEPGAKLILNGGTLTNACGEYWAGIEVWGQDDKIQLASYQGTIITKNNATIEYAKEAIQVWNPEDWASTGGIVNCTETTFKNNWRSCAYYYYHSFNSSGFEYKNKGIFTNCSFVWDDGFIGSDIAPAISMYHVNGVTIGGCDFIDSRTIDNPVRTTGIKTIDATYKVLGRNLASGGTYNPLVNQHYNYDETNFDVCNFKNLNLGIDASNSASIANVTVDHCKFENCRAGIEIKSVDNAILTRNKFTMNTSTPADIPNMNQMVVRQSTGYRIEGNIFENTNTNAIVNGSLIYNSGVEANETYKNSYSGLKSGNYAFGFNANEATDVESASGLQWKCNRNESNYFDFYNNIGYFLPNSNNDGVRLLQGTSNKASGNSFSSFINSGLPNDDLHLFSNDQENISYYHSTLQIEIPNQISGNFTTFSTLVNNICLSKFQTIIHIDKHRVLNDGIKQSKTAELESIETSLENYKTTLSIKKAAGDSSMLHSLVNNLTTSNRTTVKSTLLSASPYLSESLLRELGNINPAIFPEDWYVELLIANIEVLRNDDFISFLSTKNNPLRPEIIVDLKARRFSTFTDRGTLELKILDLSEQKEEILNLFIEDELADSLGINWTVIKNYLDQRNHLVKDAEQLDYSFGLKSDSLISNNMSSLEQNIGSISFLRMKNELNDYLMFKSYYQEVVKTNTLTNLTDDQINQFEFMAINFKGRGAQQARNILCFFENKCDLTEVLFDEESGSNGKMYTVNSSQISDELLVIPNPNNGIFELVVPKNCAIQSINVIDINGKNVKFEIGDLNENRGQIQLIDTMPGIHIISVTCNENVTFSNRILFNN